MTIKSSMSRSPAAMSASSGALFSKCAGTKSCMRRRYAGSMASNAPSASRCRLIPERPRRCLRSASCLMSSRSSTAASCAACCREEILPRYSCLARRSSSRVGGEFTHRPRLASGSGTCGVIAAYSSSQPSGTSTASDPFRVRPRGSWADGVLGPSVPVL